jgi:hypothetical protein
MKFSKTVDDIESYTRGCSINDDLLENGGNTFTYCQTDRCNAASDVKAGTAAAVAVSLIVALAMM